jgi:hypothetical protein
VLLVQACVLQSRDALPTPFSCFPFTSSPVRHRVPSHFKRSLHIYICLLNCYHVCFCHCWPWSLTEQHNFHTLGHSSMKTTPLFTTQHGGVQRNSVCRPCKGFLYPRNIIRFYPTRADVIFVAPLNVRSFLHRFMELMNTRRYYAQISHSEFHRNRTINVEVTIGTRIFITPVCHHLHQ